MATFGHAVLVAKPLENTRMFRACLAAVLALLAVAVFGAGPASCAGQFRPAGRRLSPACGCRRAIRPPARCCASATGRCRAWSFSYPRRGHGADNAACWLKNSVPTRVEAREQCLGVRGAGVVERRNSAIEMSIDRFGGDYRSFALARRRPPKAACSACEGDDRCRAWTYARPGYTGRGARCFLKSSVTPPRRRPGLISGVVR